MKAIKPFYNKKGTIMIISITQTYTPKGFGKVLDVLIEQAKLKQREMHPAGFWDKQDRFYLKEKCECCEGIRTPSKKFPKSELTHGRSLKHVAETRNVNIEDAKRLRKMLNSLSKICYLNQFNSLTASDRIELLEKCHAMYFRGKVFYSHYKITDYEASELQRYLKNNL